MPWKTPARDWLLRNVGHVGDDCLIWPYSRDRHGYGQIGVKGKVQRTHRVMCGLAHGAPPSPDCHAAHSCGNGHLGCVNPKHLFWATPSQNQYDRREHGTVNHAWWGRKGKLTAADKQRIVKLKGQHPQYVIAKMCGVSSHTVRRIHASSWRGD
jgi:hypothetical protein